MSSIAPYPLTHPNPVATREPSPPRRRRLLLPSRPPSPTLARRCRHHPVDIAVLPTPPSVAAIQPSPLSVRFKSLGFLGKATNSPLSVQPYLSSPTLESGGRGSEAKQQSYNSWICSPKIVYEFVAGEWFFLVNVLKFSLAKSTCVVPVHARVECKS